MRRFITTSTSVRHLSLSWASSIQTKPPHPTSWRSIVILFSHLRLGLPSGPFSFRFPNRKTVYASPLPHTRYMPRPSHFSRFYHPNKSLRSTLCSFLHYPVTSSLLGSAPYSQIPSVYVPPSMSATKFNTHTKQQEILQSCSILIWYLLLPLRNSRNFGDISMHRYLKNKIVPDLAMKASRGCGCIAPLILDIDAKWRWVVNFTPRPLCPLANSLGNHWIGCSVCPGWVWPFRRKKNHFLLPIIETRNIQPVPQ